MASERLSRALMSMGENLGRMAEARLTKERDEADRIHRESLARLAENRADARQERSIEARTTEAEADRKFSSAEADKERKARAAEADKDRTLTSERLSAQDRRSIEDEAAGLLADIDSREIELRDQLREGMLTEEAEKSVEDELSSLGMARIRIRYRMIEQLASMGDPRYAERSVEENMAAAGYGPEQIAAAATAAGKGGGKGSAATPEPDPYTPSLTPEQMQRRTEIWAENPDLSYAEVEALADKNPDAIPDDVIKRPKNGGGRRPKRRLAASPHLQELVGEHVVDPLADFFMQRSDVPTWRDATGRDRRLMTEDVDFGFDDERRRAKGTP